jgi:histidinol-phosphatase (PHP family)
MTEEIHRTAEVFKECGVAVEINTSGKRKPVGEMYPALDCLKIYCEAGIPLTFGSDAHDPADVGRDFAAAADLARQAGFTEYVLFENRQIERSVLL